MFGGCFRSIFPLEADLYTKNRVLNDKTGQYVDRWQFWKTIDCDITPFVSTSFKAQGTSELFDEIYTKMSFLTMRTATELSRNLLVVRIRNKNTQEILYKEVELKGSPATWYNTNGSAPITDPFGELLEYRTLINRADDQGEVL